MGPRTLRRISLGLVGRSRRIRRARVVEAPTAVVAGMAALEGMAATITPTTTPTMAMIMAPTTRLVAQCIGLAG